MKKRPGLAEAEFKAERRTIVRLVHSLKLFVLLSVLGCASKAAPEPVWIGQLLPLPGTNRTLAEHARHGVQQAVAEVQDAQVTIAGRPCAALHVESRDDAAAVQAETVRLVTVNKAVALLADFDAALTERLIRTSRSYGAPVVVPGELPGPAESDTVVSLGVPPAVRGRLLAHYASVDLKCQRAAVLTDSRRPVAAAFADAFLKAWPRDRNDAREEWTFTTAAERDERANRIIQAAPAVIVLACSVTDFRLLRPRLAAALPKVLLIYGGKDAGAAALQAELETRPDVYLATAYSPDHLSERGRAFARGYEERFHEPPDLYAAQSYDGARLLFDALQRANTPSPDALGKELSHLQQFDSVTGPVRWKDRQPLRRVFLIALKNNRPSIVSTVEAEEN
jgi:branched-chain amino acid transport system substrate-binding protein